MMSHFKPVPKASGTMGGILCTKFSLRLPDTEVLTKYSLQEEFTKLKAGFFVFCFQYFVQHTPGQA